MDSIFIGDVAGEFKTLMKLLGRCSQGRRVILLGDLNDRGPDTKSVIEWTMSAPNVDVVYANHEDMMIDWYRQTKIYEKRIWLTHNGGEYTLESYGADYINTNSEDEDLAHDDLLRPLIPKEHIEWLASRPKFIEGEGWIASHAPISPVIAWEKFLDLYRYPVSDPRFEDSIIWNRGSPRRRKDQFQIHGHTSFPNVQSAEGLSIHRDGEGMFGVGIDTSKRKKLTALLWPEKTILQEDYVRGNDALAGLPDLEA